MGLREDFCPAKGVLGWPATRLTRAAVFPGTGVLFGLLLGLFLQTPLAVAQEGQGAGGAVAGAAPIIGVASLPRDLSPWGMFLNADPVVQGVLIGLVLASLITWTVWLAKTIEIVFARRRMRSALNILARVGSVAQAANRFAENGEVGVSLSAALTELHLSAGSLDRDGIKERIASRLERLEARYGRRISRGTGVLATIGATAPFVGLFGTVWGIMNSFIGISKSHTTNLAVVAPGIAEALLATALGLAAAIPAVVIYNVFARTIASYRALIGDAAAEIMRLVSRDLERPDAAGSVSQRRGLPLGAAAE